MKRMKNRMTYNGLWLSQVLCSPAWKTYYPFMNGLQNHEWREEHFLTK